ncbi:MAG TPA: beta-ketoacyl-[acyl-carrier-protein] synthase family protein [Candidatus Saccharimonadales bacterium]|nr:beta-ketoacyl-[acyl-carrier-protein] synthase family protein [Candidatus Saccharimonadales bacterium]
MAEKDPSQRVVITGMGVMAPTPRGTHVDGFWQDLINNEHGIRPITDILEGYTDIIKTRIGAPLKEFDLKTVLEAEGFDVNDPNIKKEQRNWHRCAQAVVWSGALALRQADLLQGNSLRINERQVSPVNLGVYEGTGIGGTLTLVELQKILDEHETDGRVKPFHMLNMLPGRVDEVPAIVFNAKAFNDTMLTECAAGLSSIDRAVDELRLGRAKVVLAGGVETAAHPATIVAFERLRALNLSSEEEYKKNPKPFSVDPGGLVLGEGAGQVVLETLEHALWRQQKLGARVTILAEVLGTGKSSDAVHDTFPSKDGAGRAIDKALADAGLEPGEVNNLYVNAHATATNGDALEFMSVAERFQPDQVRGISTIKSHTGHTFGAAGTLGVITGVKSLHTGVMPANRNLHEPLPETEGWEMLPNEPKRVESVDMVEVNAFGFGGKNRVAFLGKVKG